jgi:hypothetical protein
MTEFRGDDMSDCLHCEINDLVRQRVEEEGEDIAELASMIVQSLVELILLVPENDQSKLMADVLANFGQMYLEKTGAIEAGGSGATH